ncbi:ABC-three component system middle component 6 [Hyphomonas sp. UBA3195]|uniref:ABC-three component system middle component 6 n=1 Tax=Hyphomonas sp. UBA3195 TaxID=1946622 RepID=UPI0039C86CD3|tara:strand:+ start:1091 stop:1333 length:243 start_codon:yes stop_codon:yes gene_type:complete
MILPSKHIDASNALIGVGADIISALEEPKSASVVFYEVQNTRQESGLARIHFDWFLLALDFLYTLDAIQFKGGLLRIKNK